MHSQVPAAGVLCLSCGLCCDGTLFGSVELLLEDDPGRLQELGLPIRMPHRPRFSQPCAALQADCSCAVYPERPAQCRRFSCSLLQAYERGKRSGDNALRTIRRTRAKADEIRRLLRELGETQETRPLSRRFHSVKRRMENPTVGGKPGEEELERFAALSLAVHELQFLLRREFYPDPSDLRP